MDVQLGDNFEERLEMLIWAHGEWRQREDAAAHRVEIAPSPESRERAERYLEYVRGNRELVETGLVRLGLTHED